MKKSHYIQLAILLIIAFIYASLKTGTLRIEHTIVKEPIEGVMKMQLVDNLTAETNESTTVSRDDQEIEIDGSDYETESEYEQAIEEAKIELGFSKK